MGRANRALSAAKQGNRTASKKELEEASSIRVVGGNGGRVTFAKKEQVIMLTSTEQRVSPKLTGKTRAFLRRGLRTDI
jgi:hypothetical protein